MYIGNRICSSRTRISQSILASFINHNTFFTEMASFKPGTLSKDSMRMPFATLSPATRGQTLESLYTLHRRSMRSLGRWSG